MKPTKILFLTILWGVSTLSVFSQTQSLWSKLKTENADAVGLNALQYQVPLFGQHIDFYDLFKVKRTNDWAEPHEWVVRDFNNDGFADVFLAFAGNEKEAIPFLLLIYNVNTGKFEDQSFRIKNNIGQTYNRKSIAADFNGDGILDIAAVSPPEIATFNLSYFDILLSNPDTTWTQKNIRIADRSLCEGYFHGVAAGDIDLDGDNDLVLANQSCSEGSICYINDGKGNFFAKPVSTISRGQDFVTNSWTNELADINQDGCLDLFYWHDHLNIRILYGDCKETFDNGYQDIGPLDFYVMDFDVRDFDKDGDYDLLLTTTDYLTGWRLVFKENIGNDPEGKVIWVNHTEEITESLKKQGFYPDHYAGIFYAHVVDINNDGILDIIPQQPLSNIDSYYAQPEFVGQWILLGKGSWNFSYKKLPFAEAPQTISSSFQANKVQLSWERVRQSFSTSDGGIEKWAIYAADKNWGDRSQVAKPIVVLAHDTKSENGFDQLALDPASKEMYLRIAPIDSSGIEWPLSAMHKITIHSPAISSATICDGNMLTITGANFVGINQLTVGNVDVPAFTVFSDNTIQATLNPGQAGNISLSNVAGSASFSNVTFVTPPSQPFSVTGTRCALKGEIETYSVPESPGVNFTWTFPDDWVQVSGGNANLVTVKVGTREGLIQVIPSALCGTLKPVALPVKVYTYIPDDNFQKALKNRGIDKENKPDSILTSAILNVKELNLDSMNIVDLQGLQDFSDLRILKCRSNKLQELNITGNELLEELSCGYNDLTSIDVSKNTRLKVLTCEWSQIRTLDISKNTVLNVLVCDGIPITSLDVSNNKELSLLSIYGHDIKTIDLANNTKLTYLSCVDCRLTELDVSRNVNLGLLNFSGNLLKRVDVSTNSALEYLGCANNKLVYLNLKNGNNQRLKTFYANYNPDLSCISVDDPKLAITYPDWQKDRRATYSDFCIPTTSALKESNQSIVVKPNPSKGIFQIEGLPANQQNRILVYTIEGRLIREYMTSVITETIDLKDQVSGVYVLFVNGQCFKLLKE